MRRLNLSFSLVSFLSSVLISRKKEEVHLWNSFIHDSKGGFAEARSTEKSSQATKTSQEVIETKPSDHLVLSSRLDWISNQQLSLLGARKGTKWYSSLCWLLGSYGRTEAQVGSLLTSPQPLFLYTPPSESSCLEQCKCKFVSHVINSWGPLNT